MSQPTAITTPEPRDQDFFRALELRRTDALVGRDMKTLEELHAPDYMLITPAGKVFTKKTCLAAVASEPFYSGWQAGEIDVRVCAEMAVVRYKAKLSFPSGREVVCSHTDSYEVRNGCWQAVWSQATEMPAAAWQA